MWDKFMVYGVNRPLVHNFEYLKHKWASKIQQIRAFAKKQQENKLFKSTY